MLVQSGATTANDPAFRAVVADVQRRLSDVPYTKNFESPYAPATAAQISRDGHSALLRFEIAGNEDQAKDRVDPTLAATEPPRGPHNPDFAVEQFGDASAKSSSTRRSAKTSSRRS